MKNGQNKVSTTGILYLFMLLFFSFLLRETRTSHCKHCGSSGNTRASLLRALSELSKMLISLILIRYHSDEESLGHIDHRFKRRHKHRRDRRASDDEDSVGDTDGGYDGEMPRIESQFKARSTPNVPLHTSNGEENGCHQDLNPGEHPKPILGNTTKKGGIKLEPLSSQPPTENHHKTKRKKKKGLQDRIKELKAIEEASGSPQRGGRGGRRSSNKSSASRDVSFADDSEFLSSSLPPVLRGDSSYSARGDKFCGNSASSNGIRKMKNVFKPDQISLASFSSTANDGLYPDELVLKHLAFRTSDLTVSTQIERYKVLLLLLSTV